MVKKIIPKSVIKKMLSKNGKIASNAVFLMTIPSEVSRVWQSLDFHDLGFFKTVTCYCIPY